MTSAGGDALPALLPEPLTRTEKITLGLLRGGVPVGSLTELVGESGVGKSHFCLQLLLTVQLPTEAGGLGGRSLYVYTEGEPRVDRLKEVAHRFARTAEEQEDLIDGVLVRKALEGPAELWEVLQQADTLLASGVLQPPVRLLVIDSIANPFPSAMTELTDRTLALYHVARLLKEIAHRHRVAVVVTNHVVDAPSDGAMRSAAAAGALVEAHGGLSMVASGRHVLPSLGAFWATCVTTRLYLSRSRAAHVWAPPDAEAAGEAGLTRNAAVVFAPNLPREVCQYRLAREGVFGVSPPPSGW